MIRCEAYELAVRGFATNEERVVWKLIIQRFVLALQAPAKGAIKSA
jgi:hypothetical protein